MLNSVRNYCGSGWNHVCEKTGRVYETNEVWGSDTNESPQSSAYFAAAQKLEKQRKEIIALKIPFLFEAISNQNEERALELIKNWSAQDLNEPLASGKKAIHLAAEKGLAKLVKAILEKSSEQASASCEGRATAMHHAARNGHFHIVDVLANAKPSLVNAGDYNHFTPLHYAMLGIEKSSKNSTKREKFEKIVEALKIFVKHGAKETESRCGSTPESCINDKGLYVIAKQRINAQIVNKDLDEIWMMPPLQLRARL